MKEFHCHKLQYSYPSLKSKLLLGPENHPYLTYNFNNETPLSDGRAAVAGKSTLLTICSLLLSGMDIYLVLPMYLDSLSAIDIVDILFSSVKTFSLLATSSSDSPKNHPIPFATAFFPATVLMLTTTHLHATGIHRNPATFLPT